MKKKGQETGLLLWSHEGLCTYSMFREGPVGVLAHSGNCVYAHVHVFMQNIQS